MPPTTETIVVDFSLAGLTMLFFLICTFSNKIMIIWRAFWLPFALTWIHVIGNTAQQYDYGPEFVQNHLHNLGVPSVFLIFGTWYMFPFESKKFSSASNRYYAKAKSLSRDVLLLWVLGTFCCMLQEIIDVTLYRQANMAKGYSGKLDWFDILAYIIGLGLIIYNHVKIRPIALSKVRNNLGLQPR